MNQFDEAPGEALCFALIAKANPKKAKKKKDKGYPGEGEGAAAE